MQGIHAASHQRAHRHAHTGAYLPTLLQFRLTEGSSCSGPIGSVPRTTWKDRPHTGQIVSAMTTCICGALSRISAAKVQAQDEPIITTAHKAAAGGLHAGANSGNPTDIPSPPHTFISAQTKPPQVKYVSLVCRCQRYIVPSLESQLSSTVQYSIVK